MRRGRTRPLLVVIYPYTFHDFLYHLLELEYFSRYCEVEVWDISALTTPHFSRVVNPTKAVSEGVVSVTSWRSYVRRVRELRRRSASTKVCVINEVASNSLREFFCNVVIGLFLRAAPVSIVDLYNGGLPLGRPPVDERPGAPRRPGLLAKIRTLMTDSTTLGETARRVFTAAFSVLSRQLPTSTTHRLVAGQDWVALAQERAGGRTRVQLVAGHSHDYSNYLLHRMNAPAVTQGRPMGVLLDGAGPMFAGDYALLKRKSRLTSDQWYPALSRLFDRLEAATGATVEIAGHYTTKHPPIAPYFGGRRVIYGKTRELVRDSAFVVTRASTAVSYAVIHRKPLIFIYSNQLAADTIAMSGGYLMAGTLGKELVNVDELHELDVKRLLEVDEQRYADYEKACLTSDPLGRPNVQIILEDIMKIETGPGLFA